jgi:uncharacterized repeat protein (TIGR02543 family)
MPSEPARSGYIFDGWYTAANGGGSQFIAATIVTGDITVYAKWTARYTVTYHANGASGTPPADQTINAGGSVTIPGQSGLTYAGYTFGGWNASADGTGTSYSAGDAYSPAASVTLYASWTAQYTVTYHANGASGTPPDSQTINAGSSVTLAGQRGLSYAGYIFSGWSASADGTGTSYSPGDAYTPAASVTFYAKWMTGMPTTSLQAALTWLEANAVEGGEYTITLYTNETIAPKTLSYSGKNVSITLNGNVTERTVSLSSDGSLFTIESGVTLTLGNNITLQGRSKNTDSLILVNGGGALVMDTESKISGNTNSSSTSSTYVYGGGVFVNSGGTFTMSGGTISGNTASASSSTSVYGGGVYVSGGTFTMSGGTISGNTASTGGGVYIIYSGTFTMSGGTLSDNTANGGGGVYVGYNGTFTMNGGTISDNTTSFYYGNGSSSTSAFGGGVYVDSGTFTMNNGTISGNITSGSSAFGGGVYVDSGTFTMNNGTISGNITSGSYAFGGGVYVSGTFTMSGGEISGNTASARGGGVYVNRGTFTKQSGGIICGSDASGTLKNTAGHDKYGHAVYVRSESKKRNTTAGTGVTLDSRKDEDDAKGGWE